MTDHPIHHLVLNDQVPHGLFAIRGDQAGGAIWVLDWRGRGHGWSRGLRIRGQAGNAGYDDNRWLPLAALSARNPDDPDDWRPWEIRVGWRHRWEIAMEGGGYNQTRCTAIEPVTARQVEEWLDQARAAAPRPIDPAMDPVEQLEPWLKRLLGLDRDPDEP